MRNRCCYWGLFVREFARRMRGLGQAGGESVRRDRTSQQLQLSHKPLYRRLKKSIASLRVMEHHLIAA